MTDLERGPSSAGAPSMHESSLNMTDSIHTVVERLRARTSILQDDVPKTEDIFLLREAATLISELQAVETAARKYFNGYAQDEAAERECCISDDQHADAKALQDALSAIRSLDKAGSNKTAQSNHSPSTLNTRTE